MKTWIVWFGQFRLGKVTDTGIETPTGHRYAIEAPGHEYILNSQEREDGCIPLIFREGWADMMQFFFSSVPCGAQQIKFVSQED